MKRYLLFAWMHFDPGGGWNDFKASFDFPDEAWAWLVEHSEVDPDTAQLIDSGNGRKVEIPT